MITDYLQDIEFDKDVTKIYNFDDDYGFDFPGTFCYIGPPKSGKSYAMCQITLQLINKGRLHKLWIASANYNENFKQYYSKFDIEQRILEDVMDKVKTEEFLVELIQEQEENMKEFEELHNDYPTFEEYLDFKINEDVRSPELERLQNSKPQSRIERFLLMNVISQEIQRLPPKPKEPKVFTEEEIEELKNDYNFPKLVMLMADDIQKTEVLKNAKFLNLLSRYRHLGITLQIGIHSIVGDVATLLQQCIKVWILYPTLSKKYLKLMYERIFSSMCDEKEFIKLFPKLVDGKVHLFMVINTQSGNNRKIQMRLNWNVIFEDAVEEFRKITQYLHEDIDEKKLKRKLLTKEEKENYKKIKLVPIQSDNNENL